MIVPFAWTNAEQHNPYRIQNTAYETALRKFVQEARSRYPQVVPLLKTTPDAGAHVVRYLTTHFQKTAKVYFLK
jgi:hypothetical protein